MITHKILSYKRKVILNKLVKFNGKLSEKINYHVSDDYIKYIKTDKEHGILIKYFDLSIFNPELTINGFQFLAKSEHRKDGNVIVKKLNDVNIPDRYYKSTSYCEHCDIKRYRKNTFIVYNNKTNEYKQVGSTCLTKYLGFDSSILEQHFSLFENIIDCNEIDIKSMKRHSITEGIDFEYFLKLSIVWIDRFGYKSSKSQDGVSTGKDIWLMDMNKYPELINKIDEQEIDDKYVEIYDWVYSLADNESAYVKNIRNILKYGYVTYLTCNIVSSIVSFYNTTHEKHDVPIDMSNYVGERIGQRLELDLKFIQMTTYSTQYGVSGTGYCFKFMSGNDVLVWFTTTKPLLEEGRIYHSKFTVKKHDLYKGVKQTIISRCNFK